MESNPYQPPEAPLEPPPQSFAGQLLPFEDKGNFPAFWNRVAATFRLFWTSPDRAGEGLGLRPDLGPALAFYGLVGLPVAMAAGIVQVFFPIQPWFQALLHGPKPAAPEGAMRVFALGGVLLAPLVIAFAFAILGLMNHAGLWLVGGTRAKLGLPVTFRTLLYGAAALAVPVSLAELGLDRLPGALGTAGQVVSMGAQFGIFFYQGVVFARAHRTETWRGVLGVLLPPLLFGLICGGCLAVLWWTGGDAARESLLKSLRGGN